MKIRWSRSARHDLLEIFDYIAEDNPDAAWRMKERLRRAVQAIPRHPQIGRVVPELADARIRERIVRPYRVVYTVREGDIVILAIVHGKRLLPVLPEE